MERLRRGDLGANKNTAGIDFKPEEMADELEPPVVRMRKAHKQIERERREYEKAVIAKSKAGPTPEEARSGSNRTLDAERLADLFAE